MTLHNTERNEYLEDLQSRISHIAFFTNYRKFQETDVISGKYEIYRVVPSAKNIVGQQLEITFTLPTEFVLSESTVTDVISNVQFTLADASFFENIDELIEIELDTSEIVDREIIARSGNTITISEPLTSDAVKARQKIAQKAVIKDGELTANSGFIMESYEEWFHKSSAIINGQLFITYKGT